ncbi:MAG: SpoIIE family protein phosphatase [Candidatus Peregrinibacteria bacterium]|nr:SpoIIE family protein phosphatase [Candidatus Peregrinibacteria bacterium]
MLRSVKSQIILATSAIIILILGAASYLVIDQEIRDINQDIFTETVNFAELTHERIIDNYEQNYVNQLFVNFEREMAEIYRLNQDISGLAILDYSGEMRYVDVVEEHLSGHVETEDIERIQAIYPSVKSKKDGRVVYLEKTDDGIRYTNLNGNEVEPIRETEQIHDIYFPFRDPNDALRAYSVHFDVTYSTLIERVRNTIIRMSATAVAGILIALIIGYLVAHGITSPIRSLTEGAAALGRGDLKIRIPLKSKNEVGMLADTFNHMAADLEKSTEERVAHEKVAKELELAAEIQRELLPTQLPEVKGLDLAASLNAATEVGGDCYDFIPREKKGDLLFYIADVTGHGVGAGLVSAINNALIPSLMDHYDTTKDIVTHLNVLLKLKTSPNIFVTLVMALWNPENGSLEYTQAGHDPILHFKAKDGSVEELAKGGIAMGMVPDVSKTIKTESVKAQKDDVFILYTDGIPEAWKNESETFGMDRLKDSLKKHGKLKTAQEIHDAILKDVREFMGSVEQADDITLLAIKRSS